MEVNAPSTNFKWKTLFSIRAVLTIVILLAALALAPEVFLLIFAGLLLSVFLMSTSNFIKEKTGVSYGISLALVCLTIIIAIAGGFYLMAPSIAEQTDQLTQTLPKSFEKIRTSLSEYSWAQPLMSEVNPENVLDGSGSTFSKATGAVSSVLGWITNLVIILFIGLYGAIEPGTYRRGLLHLIPQTKRDRASQVLSEVRETLGWWLIGKFFGMAVIGILTTVGLWFLDVPLALILGIIAALFTFIPNIGPILSAIPALLLALTISPQKALYVAILYFVIQFVESYLLTPLVQRKTVSLPPGLTLGAQVLLGVLFGALGVALATPLTAMGLVLTKMLYVEDILGDDLSHSPTG